MTSPTSHSGDRVGIDGAVDELDVPQGYASGTRLADSSTYDNRSLNSLGVTPGTYVWTWGSGVDADSFTVRIGTPPAVPEPASFALLGAGLLGLGAARRQTSA